MDVCMAMSKRTAKETIQVGNWSFPVSVINHTQRMCSHYSDTKVVQGDFRYNSSASYRLTDVSCSVARASHCLRLTVLDAMCD